VSWSLSASGHCPDQDAERTFLDELHATLADPVAGAGSATIYTQYHGQVNLLTEADTTADEANQPVAPEQRSGTATLSADTDTQ